MDRVFKRPMFRKGGQAGEGIMQNAVPRRNYQDGSDLETDYQQRLKFLEKTIGAKKDRSLSDFLIRSGLSLGATEPTGSLLQTVAKAVQKPYEQFSADKAAEDQFRRQLKLTAATGALSKDQALDFARRKMINEKELLKMQLDAKVQNKLFESQTAESQYKSTTEQLFNAYPGEFGQSKEVRKRIPAIARAAVDSKRAGANITLDIDYEAVTKGKGRYVPNIRPGQIYYDPFKGYVKRVKVTGDPSQDYILVDASGTALIQTEK